MTDFDPAVRAFWTGRDLQTQKQIDSGSIDAGGRGAVTGGQHLGPMQDVVAGLFHDPELPGLTIKHKGKITLPGYYRRSKDWDLVVTYKGELVAAVEFKSQVGPSFGNNFNNRVEESIGNAVDVWRGYEEGLFGEVRPWIGFLMVIERAPGSIKTVKDSRTVYPTDPVFDQTGYVDRYRILLQRLVRERLYDAAAVISTERGQGIFDDPIKDLSPHGFEAAIVGRMAYIKALGL